MSRNKANIAGDLNAESSKRLLLNDPSVLADRLTKLESKIQQQDVTIQQLTSGKQKQDATIQHQATEIQNLQATLNQHDIGTTYIRWARKQCPYNYTELVYSGFAGGGYYDQTGASAEPVCLPPDPEFVRTSGGDYGRMYGAEFDENFFHPNAARQDIPCAVCRVRFASSIIMIPGKISCNSGWTKEYHGYLGSNYHDHKASGTFVCIDIQPEFLTGGEVNHEGKLFYPVLAKCGSLQCPPYKNDYPLTCVVCSK